MEDFNDNNNTLTLMGFSKNISQTWDNYSTSSNSVSHIEKVFAIEDPLHKLSLISIQILLCTAMCFNLWSMIDYNDNRPIQQQNLMDNLLLKNLCPFMIAETVVHSFFIIWKVGIGPVSEWSMCVVVGFYRHNQISLHLTLFQWEILKILYKSMTLRIGQINEDFFQIYLLILNSSLSLIFFAWHSVDGIKFYLIAGIFTGQNLMSQEDEEIRIDRLVASIGWGLNLSMHFFHTFVPEHILYKLRDFLYKLRDYVKTKPDEEIKKDEGLAKSKKLPPIIKDSQIVECSFIILFIYATIIFMMIFIITFGQKILDSNNINEFPNTILFMLFLNLSNFLRGFFLPYICVMKKRNNIKLIGHYVFDVKKFLE